MSNFQTTAEDPREHLGVFASLDDVTPRYRLSRLEADYEGVDVYADFLQTLVNVEELGDYQRKYTYEALERRWKDHMAETGRHHALPTPGDVETFFHNQAEQVGMKTLYGKRYVPLNRFFEWLWLHPNYEHAYNPVLLAVVAGGTARQIWDYRTQRNQNQRVNNE